MANILNLKSQPAPSIPLKDETKAALGTDSSRKFVEYLNQAADEIRARAKNGAIISVGVKDALENFMDAVRELEEVSTSKRGISLRKEDYRFPPNPANTTELQIPPRVKNR